MMDIKQYILLLVVCLLQIGNSLAKNIEPLVGVVAQKDGHLNVYTTSETIKANQKIGLLDPAGNYKCCLNVSRQLVRDAETDVPLIDYSGNSVNVFTLELRGKLVRQFREKHPFGVALRPGTRIVESKKNVYILQYAGKKIVLTICTSQEGLHVITKQLSDNHPLEHLYYYFGHDVEPTCGTLITTDR